MTDEVDVLEVEDVVELDRRCLERGGWVPLKLTEWMDAIAVVVLFIAPPPTPPTPLLILLIPLSLLQLIVLRSLIATELALCTIPSFVPNGRSSTTRV